MKSLVTMLGRRSSIGLTICASVLLLWGSEARADYPIPKWIQMPDLTYTGIDVNATDTLLADDFLCWDPIPMTDAHIWGSWLDDQVADPLSLMFHLSIHADIPADAAGGPGYSMPGDLLWEHDFFPGEYKALLFKVHDTNLEGWYDPATGLYLPQNHREVWQYNFDFPDNPFFQKGTQEEPIVYWLDVQAIVTGPEKFGWKTSITHWNDDAVYNEDVVWEELWYPAAHPFDGESIDLAFVITPEPATLALLAIGSLLLVTRRK